MIFEQVQLYNFGIYKGKHVIDLDPVKVKQPVILLGGLNGGGKTTFLDSLQLALYGKHAKCSNRGRLAYKDYLKQTINRYAKQKEASVSLTFRHAKGTAVNRYEIIRSWDYGEVKGLQEKVEVLTNGKLDIFLADHWDDFVSEFIPRSMSELFFFDGEKIEELTNPTRSAQFIKTGVEALLGLELLSQLSQDLKSQRRNRQEKDLDRSTSQKVEELKNRLQDQESRLNDLQGEIERIGVNNQKLVDELKNIEMEMINSGAHLVESLKDLKNEHKLLLGQLDTTDGNIIKVASNTLPLLVAKKLFLATQTQAEYETEASELKSAQVHIDHQNEEILDLLKNSQSEEVIESIQDIITKLNNKREKQIDSSQSRLSVNPALFAIATSALDRDVKECQQLLEDKNKIQDNISIVLNKIEAIPDSETVKEQIEHKSNISDEIEENRKHLDSVIDDYNQCKLQIAETEARLDATLVQKNADNFEQQRDLQVTDHLVEMKSIIDSFKSEMVAENICNLEHEIISKFKLLERKKQLISKVKICPHTFSLSIFGDAEKPLKPNRLSAGERHLLSVAILWALADESGKEIPTIIDSPMGRLDGEHRAKLITNYFPQAASQVILLSTDEEIIGSYYTQLKPAVAQEYHIHYVEDQQTSIIQPGYFN